MAGDMGTGDGALVAPGLVPQPMTPADAPLAVATSGKAEAFSVAASAIAHLLVVFLLLAIGSLASAQKPPQVIPVKLIPADQVPKKPLPHPAQKQAAAPAHKQAAAPAHKAVTPPAQKQPPVPPPKAADKAPAKDAAASAKAPPPPAEAKKAPSWRDLAASLGMAEYGRKTTLPKALLAALSAQVKRCWTIPGGWSDPRQVSVTLRFQLQPNGTLDGDPAIVEFPATPIGAAAAKAAMEAVKKCGPYHLPPAQYDEWKDIQLGLAP